MISVILIASDAGAWIDRAIRSVLANGYRDWEMVVVDNSSTDNTREIADSYAANDLRIKVHTVPRTTLGGVRHAGVKLAKSDWFTFLNATDTLEPGALQWMVNHIPDDDSGTSVGAIVGGIRCIDSRNRPYGLRGAFSGLLSMGGYIDGLLRGDFTPIFGGKLLRRASYPNNPSYLDSEVEFAHELIALAAKLHYHKEVYVNGKEYVYTYYPDILDIPHSFNFRGWLKAIGALGEFVPDNEAFFRFRLWTLYHGCIITGSMFPSFHSEIKRLRADAAKYPTDANQRHILRLTRFRRARIKEARKKRTRGADAATLISVVMIVHDGAHQVMTPIKSLQNQTFQDWELIVVDDASTDDTSAVVRAVASSDPRVRLITLSDQVERGEARISALNLAKGDYIGFINPTDQYAPEALAKLWERASATGADVVLMGSSLVSKHKWIRVPIMRPEEVFDKPLLSTYELTLSLLRGEVPYRQCDRIYKCDTVRRNPVKYERGIDETLFNLHSFRGKGLVAWTPYVGFLWHPTQLFATPYTEMMQDQLEGCRRLKKLLDDEQWPDREELMGCMMEGMVRYFLDFLAIGLDNSWREGVQRMIDAALSDELMVQALEYCGISPDEEGVMRQGRKRYRQVELQVRKYKWLDRL